LIDFVVCTRNNRDIVGTTLECIAAQTVRGCTCTVVDGQSADGTPDLVRQKFPQIRLVCKSGDTGPSNSRNIGLGKGTAEWIAFIDSDVRLDSRWAESQLKAAAADPRIGMAGSKLLFSRNTELLYAAYGVMSRYGIGWDGGRAEPAREFTEIRRCLWVNSSAMFVRRKLIDQIGGFDDAMFLGGEDADIGWRANLFGWHVVSNPNAVAVHDVHGTLDPKAMSRHLVHLIWRNRLRSAFINYETSNIFRYTSIFLMLSLADSILRPPRKEKISALLWNLAH
jgi:GT2 family glycosyltransferase